jgi:hypothetical protein
MSILNSASDIGQSTGSRLSSIGNNLSSGISNVVSGFSENNSNMSSEFMNSNSIIAKFAFIILVILGFALLLNLGIAVIYYYFSPPPSPYLINGMIDGTNGIVISQDPKKLDSITILRSDNQTTGLEFTWSTWLYVTDPGSHAKTKYQNIFNKGNGVYKSLVTAGQDSITFNNLMNTMGITSSSSADGISTTYVVPRVADSKFKSGLGSCGPSDTPTSGETSNSDFRSNTATGIASVNNGPGLYMVASSSSASIIAVMDTVDPQNPVQAMKVDNCPINKWFHVALRMENNIMDIYINGTISGRTLLTGVPRQNYNDVNICQNGGFNGNLSNLRYYNKALSSFEINGIVRTGPNITPVNSSMADTRYSYYLADSWFYSKLTSM